jgi:hypothetical protein
MALPGFDLLTKAARLLVGRRYTSTDLGDSQESFTSTIQIGYDEIWSETRSIPSASLPYYNLPYNSTTSSLGVTKYWYKWPLTVANNTTLTASSVWFFLDPTGSNSGVGSQLIQSEQQTNFISPKYSEATLTNYYADGDYNSGSAGYNIALFSSPNGSTFTRLDASALYQFDYKTGVLQFTSKVVPTNRVYATVYQYIGKTLAGGSDMNFTNITASNISASGVITASSIYTPNLFSDSISASSFTSSISNGIGFMGTSSYSVTSSYSISSSYSSTSSYAYNAGTASFSQNAQDILIYAKNDSGEILQKGTVVRIVGVDTSINVAKIQLADYSNENNSANTLGFTNETFAINAFGYVMTEGLLTSVNTDGFTAGDLLYLSSSGTYTNVTPTAPLHGVRLGQAIKIQQNNGSIYVRIDNGIELGEAHNVVDNTTSNSYGDLLIKSGSVWINSKNLTGSYTATGSFSGQTGSFIYFNINNTGSAPTSPSQIGNVGEIRFDDNFIYIYTQQQWIRSPVSKWTNS